MKNKKKLSQTVRTLEVEVLFLSSILVDRTCKHSFLTQTDSRCSNEFKLPSYLQIFLALVMIVVLPDYNNQLHTLHLHLTFDDLQNHKGLNVPPLLMKIFYVSFL